MDILEECQKSIKHSLELLENKIETERAQENYGDFQQTQTAIEAVISEKDKNLDRILAQQRHVQMLIERDSRIKSLRAAIKAANFAIEQLRKGVSEMSREAIRVRQKLIQDQAEEVEKFQMQQMKSIADDQRRHKDILDLRKKETILIKNEIENEEKNRPTIVADIRRNLEQQLKERQEMSRGNRSGVSFNPLNNIDSECVELGSVNEYAPYGPTATSGSTAQRARRGGAPRGRGRKRGGGVAA